MLHLVAAVAEKRGEIPRLFDYHGRHSTSTNASPAYIGENPAEIVFELAAILSLKAEQAALESGYHYGPQDVEEELRTLISQIGSPHVEVSGREILYYWSTVIIRH